ncbi:MAG: tetratricopeptide repeat protein [Thermodesulfobacteriota bacterium]
MHTCNIVSRCTALALMMTLFVLLAGCSLPKVILHHDPLSASEHRDLAAIYAEKGKYNLAEREYTIALELDPESMASYLGLGNLYLTRGMYRQAEGVFIKALERVPSSGPLHNNLSWAYLGMGDHDRAERHVLRALELDPPRRHIYLDTLAVVYTGKGEYDKAEVSLLEALTRVPSDERAGRVEIYSHLIELYRLWEKREKARSFEQKLIEEENNEHE